MDRYEYKFVRSPLKIGFDYEDKLKETEKQWNDLGQNGWMFCKEGNGCIIFIRKLEQNIQ